MVRGGEGRSLQGRPGSGAWASGRTSPFSLGFPWTPHPFQGGPRGLNAP
ncbi:hypothetical protein TCCBUS3UF1_1420 [Thermus sp. CCB_US3_UF1]|nr:hypothetical protein TCCBUS3UF1_1420 [Thermus sp. CCB_US3_UF1]